MDKILLIIPAYNESKVIVDVCNKIKLYNENNIYIDISYIVINDGSKDNTEEICKKNDIKTINLVSNLGIGGAVQAGYKYAYENNYDIAIQFDGDGQHDINYVPIIIEDIINQKSDIVIGSRYIKGNKSKFQSTKMRIFGKSIISSFIKLVCGVKVTDPTSGFRAVNRKVIKEFVSYYPYDYPEPESIVYLIKKGYKLIERPVSMNERTSGKSSIRMFKTVHYMIKVVLAILIEGYKIR